MMKNRLEGKGQHEVITLTVLPSLTRANSGWPVVWGGLEAEGLF